MGEIKVYDLIFSIGEACSCTQILRQVELQDFSYPLDWLFGASFTDRIKIVASKFENFFNKDDLIYAYTEEAVPFDAYKNTLNDMTFNHDFPKNVPLIYPTMK